MAYFVGLDASKKTTYICVLDRDGRVDREGMVETSPRAIIDFLRGERRRYVRVGMEAWTMARWLYEGLAKAGLPIVIIETRNAHGILKTQRNKTDRNDARGIANLMRMGTYRKVHVKSQASQEILAMLTTRRLLSEKARDIDNAIRGFLLGAGLKLAAKGRCTFDQRVEVLAGRHPFAAAMIRSLLAARTALISEKIVIEGKLLSIARNDAVCRRLMTAPGIGELTALCFKSAIDEPHRFPKSRAVGAHFGMTPKTIQSGETLFRGRITGWGDGAVRQGLVVAAWTLFRKNTRRSWLSDWAVQIAQRRGAGKAIVAAARRLAIVLHRMWVSETDFQWKSAMA
jgi:transposase